MRGIMKKSQVYIGGKYQLISEIHYETVDNPKPVKIVEVTDIVESFIGSKVHFRILQGSDKHQGKMNLNQFIVNYEPYVD